MSKEDRIWREGDPRWEWMQGEPVPRYMWSQVPRSFVVGRLNRTSELEQQVEALKGLLRVARCPDTYCNGFGTCADGDPADPTNVEIWQCQWCDERTKATAQQEGEE